MSSELSENKKTNLPLSDYLDRHEQLALYKLREKLEIDGRDTRSMLEVQFRRISPKCAQSITDAVNRAMADWFGPTARGDTVPVDFYLVLCDQSMLWVRVDPNLGCYRVKYGSRF